MAANPAAGKGDQDHANPDGAESDDRRHPEARDRPDKEPQNRAQNLPAVERIERHDVEDQQEGVDNPHHAEVFRRVRRQMHERGQVIESKRYRDQNHIHQRPGRDRPERRTRALRRLDKGDAAQRPEKNFVRFASHRARGQGVAEFVHQHDGENRQQLDEVPDFGVIIRLAILELLERQEQPTEVHEDIDPPEAKQP